MSLAARCIVKVHQRSKKKLSPVAVYRALLKRFGPQGWWPVTPHGKRQPEYLPGRYMARPSAEAFEICLGAILTQNTAWKNVEKAIVNLNAARALTPVAIARMQREDLAALIRPSGYFNQKAERLQLFCKHMLSACGGDMERFFSRSLPELRRELLSLKGVGPETADSMLLYAGGKPVFVVDAYTLRVGERLGWYRGLDYQAVQDFFHANLTLSTALCNEYHALIVALCKYHCTKKPSCGNCPLIRVCSYE